MAWIVVKHHSQLSSDVSSQAPLNGTGNRVTLERGVLNVFLFFLFHYYGGCMGIPPELYFALFSSSVSFSPAFPFPVF